MSTKKMNGKVFEQRAICQETGEEEIRQRTWGFEWYDILPNKLFLKRSDFIGFKLDPRKVEMREHKGKLIVKTKCHHQENELHISKENQRFWYALIDGVNFLLEVTLDARIICAHMKFIQRQYLREVLI